jgi:hypothetical protein
MMRQKDKMTNWCLTVCVCDTKLMVLYFLKEEQEKTQKQRQSLKSARE